MWHKRYLECVLGELPCIWGSARGKPKGLPLSRQFKLGAFDCSALWGKCSKGHKVLYRRQETRPDPTEWREKRLCRFTLRNPWVAALLRGYVKPPSQMPRAVDVEPPPHTHKQWLPVPSGTQDPTHKRPPCSSHLLQGLAGVFCSSIPKTHFSYKHWRTADRTSSPHLYNTGTTCSPGRQVDGIVNTQCHSSYM